MYDGFWKSMDQRYTISAIKSTGLLSVDKAASDYAPFLPFVDGTGVLVHSCANFCLRFCRNSSLFSVIFLLALNSNTSSSGI